MPPIRQGNMNVASRIKNLLTYDVKLNFKDPRWTSTISHKLPGKGLADVFTISA